MDARRGAVKGGRAGGFGGGTYNDAAGGDIQTLAVSAEKARRGLRRKVVRGGRSSYRFIRKIRR
jgi:hypothetical protein